jgi:hypothetical protein
MGSQEVRALLVARKRFLGRLIDVELSIRGILRGFGLKVGGVTRKIPLNSADIVAREKWHPSFARRHDGHSIGTA